MKRCFIAGIKNKGLLSTKYRYRQNFKNIFKSLFKITFFMHYYFIALLLYNKTHTACVIFIYKHSAKRSFTFAMQPKPTLFKIVNN